MDDLSYYLALRRHARMLATLADRGLAMTRQVHDRLLEESDHNKVIALSDEFNRVAKEVREAIAQKAKIDRDIRDFERENPELARRRHAIGRRAEGPAPANDDKTRH